MHDISDDSRFFYKSKNALVEFLLIEYLKPTNHNKHLKPSSHYIPNPLVIMNINWVYIQSTHFIIIIIGWYCAYQEQHAQKNREWLACLISFVFCILSPFFMSLFIAIASQIKNVVKYYHTNHSIVSSIKDI